MTLTVPRKCKLSDDIAMEPEKKMRTQFQQMMLRNGVDQPAAKMQE